MKARSILFSAPMVRALPDGSKTQTRRVMRDQVVAPDIVQMAGPGYCEIVNGYGVHIPGFRCPHGQPGDRMWVRETYFAFGRWETRYSAKKNRDEWHFVDLTLDTGKAYRYAADGDGLWSMAGRRRLAGAVPGWWKRPAIFMPRAASRILLEITNVRAERLQDINELDAMDEGFYQAVHESPTGIGQDVVGWYRALWEQLNGAGSWAANPWVWVVEFRGIRP